jgi:FkbH-like protein
MVCPTEQAKGLLHNLCGIGLFSRPLAYPEVFLDLRLIEALEIIHQARPSDLEPFRLALACGFTPLHLATFLHAKVKQSFQDRNVLLVETGVYGDLIGNLQRAVKVRPDATAVVIEWPDLDQRLGVRQLGGWDPKAAHEIVDCVRLSLERIKAGLACLSDQSQVAVCPPTLSLPPFSHEAGWHAGHGELQLRSSLAVFLLEIAELKNVRIVSRQALDRTTPEPERFDVKSEINAGFPYSMKHAGAVAELLARLIHSVPPKKGLITDLDDTFWRGILGEVGVSGVGWDLSRKAHIHGLYQQFLAALSRRGVLVAVVSKNDPKLVQEAFRERTDLLAGSANLYPIEAGWGRKSEAAARVIQTWNIAADSVVFVDDSPLELEEVKSAHPGIETFRFPTDNPAAAWDLILQLQDLFGKSTVLEEDRIRLASLRNADEFSQSAVSGPSEDEFLERTQAYVTIETGPQAADARALELLNKTNQFNLNGRRIEEGEWRRHLSRPDTFLFVVSYQDKFGPLGKIAVITGSLRPGSLNITSWVMSCRAFARRIEHQCMKLLFQWFDADELILNYESTPRNGPTAEFLNAITAGTLPSPARISRADFESRCPRLFHTVVRSTNE